MYFKIITEIAAFTSLKEIEYCMVGVRAPSIGFIVNLILGKLEVNSTSCPCFINIFS